MSNRKRVVPALVVGLPVTAFNTTAATAAAFLHAGVKVTRVITVRVTQEGS